MQLRYYLAASAASLSLACGLATPAAAQQIVSGIDGTVEDEFGQPISGATVTIIDTRTGSTRTSVTGVDGRFRTENLVTGGPYTVTVTAEGFEGQTVQNQIINLQGNTQFRFSLATGLTTDVIVVSATRANAVQETVGPGSSFGQEELVGFPSITRDVRDIIRIDPRVSLDRANEVDRISCLGGNDRSNAFTVDGITQNDTFGLNGTPFAARNALPIPFDAIRETSVEFAPFDVEYSDFTGCAVNTVTKSGENQFHGSAFYTFTNEDLRGDAAGDEPSTVPPFEEQRWGVTLSGPIIPDTLFFFAGYEETDLGDANEEGPFGSGLPNEQNFVTQAQFDEFSRIANDVYGIDTGGFPLNLPESSVRYFGRLDWYINDQHRLEGTYQRLEETNVEDDFGGQNVTGLNSFEDEGTVSDKFSIRLFSEWTDNISTELRFSRAEVGDVQGPVGGGEAQSDNPITRLVVGVPNETSGLIPSGDPALGSPQNGILSTGPGIFRSANQLDTTITQARALMNIDFGDHNLKIGAELNDLEVFNLFAINATGTIYFRNLEDFANGVVASGNFSSVFGDVADELISGNLGGATIRSTPTGDINAAAAQFSRQIYSAFVQDDWQVTDQFDVSIGARFQVYDGDAPNANPQFLNRFGFTNANGFGQLDPLILPRFSATYNFDNEGFFRNSRLTGGFGLFTGGDPVVFFSNAFSNDGFASVDGDTFSDECAGLLDANGNFSVLDNGQFTGFPQCAVQEAINDAAVGGGEVQSTDPNLENPTVFRANLGFQTAFGADTGFFSDWNLDVNYIYSQFRNPFNFVDLLQTPDITEGLNGFTVDGRPIYAAIDPLRDGCNAQLQNQGGTPPTWTGVSSACFGTGLDDFIQLTNGRNFESHVASFALSKYFSRGLFTEGGSVNVSLGYAFTDSTNFRNVGSSTATSNFDVSAAFDRQNPRNSTSNFETQHNITFAMNFQEQFFEDYDTRFGIFFQARSGRPFSLTFDGGGDFADSASGNDNALLYIPTGINDPNIAQPIFDAMGNQIGGSDLGAVQALVDYLDNNTNGISAACDFTRGQTISRNTCNNDWVFDLDLRFSQELPGPGSLFGLDDRITLYADFDNILNMIDSDWNVLRTRSDFVDLVEAGNVLDDPNDPDGDIFVPAVDNQGRYVISGFNPDDQNNVGFSNSVWRIQLGVRYEF
ncbi:MAG: carboxypeptidase regulatory-like domain-containing protein [Pseudomonadota bacterium]